MNTLKSDQELLQAIAEAEESIRHQIADAERRKEEILERARSVVATHQRESQVDLRIRLDKIREERQRGIDAELDALLRDALEQVRALDERARTHVEPAGQYVLKKILAVQEKTSEG